MTMMGGLSVGIGAGVLAGLLHAAILQPSPMTTLLFYASPLPIFFAGLGWGVKAAALGAFAGTLLMLLVAGMAPALTFLASAGAGPTILVWLALKSRPAEGPPVEGEAEAQGYQWYPEGRLVLWAAAMAGALTAAAILIAAPDLETFRAETEELVSRMVAAMSEGMGQAEIERLRDMVRMMVAILPLVAASVWLLSTLINLKLAATILSSLKLGLRPWARFGALAFPRKAAFALPMALAASFLPGMAGFIGSLFAAAVFTAFALLGLAVLHGLTEGMRMRGVLLASLYLALFLLNWLLVVPFAALGLLDMALNMRARPSTPPTPPNLPSTE